LRALSLHYIIEGLKPSKHSVSNIKISCSGGGRWRSKEAVIGDHQSLEWWMAVIEVVAKVVVDD
jgi:hypothetical protein